MKKILSFTLALAMALAMFTINVNAAVTATFDVSYEDVDGNIIDPSTLTADSLFFVRIEMDNLETLKIVDTKLTWDPAIVKVIDNKGNDATSSTKIAGYTTARASKTILEEYEETFLSESAALYPEAGRAELTSYAEDANILYQKDDNVIAVYRFKVIKEGNANFALVAKVNAGEGLEEISQDVTNVPACVIGSGEITPSTPDAVKFYAVLPACKKAEASAVAQFQFDSNADGVADKGYNYDLGSLTWDTDVTVGVQVEEIDDGVTLALTNVLWK